MMQPVVIDVETQYTFREVGGFIPQKLKVSVACLYDYQTDKYLAFTEKELPQFFKYLENSSLIIGFNQISFDLPVLSAYYLGDIKKFPTLDLLNHVEKSLGFRISLDDLVRETLGAKKTGHGLLAIEYFRSGDMEKLKKYCLSDVELTRKLFEYGKQHGEVYYKNASGRRKIAVDWKNLNSKSSQINLTMPW
jgi:DEAD/DEAH box helicase domain-containing protein